jgi:hypothetical protein
MNSSDRPTTPMERPVRGRPSSAPPPGLLTLMFELSLAAALPPEAFLAPPAAVRPTVRPGTHGVLSARHVEAVLGRPAVAAGSAHVPLGEIDQRLHGLLVRLDAFHVGEGARAPVAIGLVSPEPGPPIAGRTTACDLWRLANAALVEHAVPCEHLLGLGDDAFLALHGGRTAQVAWLVGGRLATVSVTSPGGDKHWAIEAARALAREADDRLSSEHRGGPSRATRAG